MRHLAAFIVGAALSAQAKFAMPELVPVERLVKNAEAYVQAHPGDAFAHYTVGRIHYLAFVLKIGMVPAHAPAADGLPRPARDQLLGQPLATIRRQRAETLAREELGIKDEAPPADTLPAYLRAASKHLKQLEIEFLLAKHDTYMLKTRGMILKPAASRNVKFLFVITVRA